MDVHKLDHIFKPQRIALVGVSGNPNSVGGTVLRNLISAGFRGVVYPVNPTAEAVLGIHCYPSLRDLPKIPDLAVICTAAIDVPKTVRECGEMGIFGIIIISAGFKEIGEEGRILEEKILEESRKFDQMRIIGPNCLGIINPELNLNATFAGSMPKAGHVAFISQSGALCTSVLDWALEEKIGFSYFVSIGNCLDVTFSDLIDYFGEDEKTKSIILYIESIKNARKFMTAARSFARTKPIVAYKAGRFPESAQAAASHTGAMAAEDDVYEAAFQRAGIVRVFDIGDIFDCAELIGRHKTPRGPRLGIVTNAGGPGVMATDALIAGKGTLAPLSHATIENLNEHLPPFWSHNNPVDVLGDARSKRFAKAVQLVLEDKQVDAVLAILTPQAMTNASTTAKAVGELAANTKKPILASWLGGLSMREGIDILTREGIATYSTPEQAVRAFMTLVSYSRNLEILYETPRDIPVQFSWDRKKLREDFTQIIAGEGSVLSESTSKILLSSYGIPVTRPQAAATIPEAIDIARQVGYPVVLKIQSPDITHKSDVGGVRLDIQDDAILASAFEQMMIQVREKQPDARLEGVTVQKMIKGASGIELILGVKQDPVFGSVLMAGLGGTGAEIFRDRALGFPPLNERLARRMLESLKSWPLLTGYRGKSAINLDRLIEIMMRLSYLAADYPEIKELDINPLLVTQEDAIALDARIVFDTSIDAAAMKPYSHLALRPYPEEYIRSARLNDGTEVVLRPIKPEDEPLWMDLLGSCSRESIYMRFRYMFHWQSHDVAVRYCFIDYDREMAIVAERNEDGKRKLLGVGRLVCAPDLTTGEYAVLIADAWQNKGLGGLLTDYCTEIAHKWGLKRLLAQTTTDNARMIKLFQERNFSLEIGSSGSLVDVEKPLI